MYVFIFQVFKVYGNPDSAATGGKDAAALIW